MKPGAPFLGDEGTGAYSGRSRRSARRCRRRRAKISFVMERSHHTQRTGDSLVPRRSLAAWRGGGKSDHCRARRPIVSPAKGLADCPRARGAQAIVRRESLGGLRRRQGRKHPMVERFQRNAQAPAYSANRRRTGSCLGQTKVNLPRHRHAAQGPPPRACPPGSFARRRPRRRSKRRCRHPGLAPGSSLGTS